MGVNEGSGPMVSGGLLALHGDRGRFQSGTGTPGRRVSGKDPVRTDEIAPDKSDEQEHLAREIGEELTDAFIAFVRGDVPFADLTFGVFDALSDLHVIASGEYELEEPGDGEEDVEDEE